MPDELENRQQPEDRREMEPPASIWTRNFILLCLSNLMMFMSMHLLLPTLPVYLLEIGGAQKDVGYVMGAYTICAMATRPITGWLVDSYGRKRIMIFGMVMLLACSTLYKLATSVSLLMMIRGSHGMAFGIVSTAVGTIVADSLPAARLGEGMGYFGLTTSLSMSLAPIIGFWLVEKSGYSALFIAVAILALLAFFCSLSLPAAHLPIRTSDSSMTGIWSNLLEKTALPASGVMFFLAVVYGSVLSFISLYAVELGITNIGLFFTALALSMLVSRPVSGRWTDHNGTNIVLLIGHLTLLIGMGAIVLSHTIMGFLLAGTALGIGFGFCISTLQALSVRHAPTHRRGAATATFFVSFDLGIGLGTVFWGYLAEATSYQVMYLATLIPLALAGAIYYRHRDCRPPVYCQKPGV